MKGPGASHASPKTSGRRRNAKGFAPALVLLLLAASLGIKVHLGAATRFADQYPGYADIIAMLAKNQFAVSGPDAGTDPAWLTGIRDGCRVDVANVSPQGWHRAAVEWKAGGATIRYSAAGIVREHQPILGPMLRHYLSRMQRYLGFDAPAPRIRAIIIGRDCPSDRTLLNDLAALSG